MILPTRNEREFAGSLERLARDENRAALAALRRGLGKRPGAVAEMYPYIVRWVPRDASPADEEAYFLVASLYGEHQGAWQSDDASGRPTNLGASFKRLAAAMASDSMERRFIALLNCHREDLPEHLRHAVALLRSQDIPVDWALLLHDIRAWEREDRAVQRSWARAFYENLAEPKTDATAPGADIAHLDSENESIE